VGESSTDITERTRMEAAMALLAAIVESSDDAIISKTPDGIVTTWNKGAEKIFGYSASEMIGQPVSLLIPPESLDEESEILARIQRGEAVDNYETTRIRKDGALIDVSLTVSPLRDANGRIVGASKIARDMSERKRANERLQAQVERLSLLDHITRAMGERQDLRSIFQVVVRSLEESLPIAFGCVCLCDSAAESLTVACVGVRSEMLAMQLAMAEHGRISIDQNGLARCVGGQLIYESDLRQADSPFRRRLLEGGLCSAVLAPLQFESRVFGVLVAARQQPDAFSSGDCEFLRQLSGHVALAAHQAELHDALQLAYDDLRQSQQVVIQQERLRALGQMASGIAHDVNNALAPVALYTESLLEQEPNLSKNTREYLETTQRALEDITHTVARMQEFYRERAPRLMLVPLDLNRMVQQVLDLTRARWSDMPHKRGIVIETTVNLAQDLPRVAGIESEIRDALVNLIFNGVDAMPDGGALTLRTRASRGGVSSSLVLPHVDVEITDTGQGMDGETRRRCLEPFFTTKGERGTGLGLAMVFGAVQRHNAEIQIESAPGVGTTMRLSFPVFSGQEPESAHTGDIAIPPRMRILVIDDDPLVLKSLRHILEGDGHVIVTANGGKEGIEVFQAAQAEAQFAVVITDLGMPRIDGRGVAAAVKALHPSTGVILLTGWGQRLIAEGDVPAQVDCVLSKPPKLRELRAALVQVAGSSSPGAHS
jgi:PAS domain S-box-containing protein